MCWQTRGRLAGMPAADTVGAPLACMPEPDTVGARLKGSAETRDAVLDALEAETTIEPAVALAAAPAIV
jgi:hypothetical protein